MRHRMGRARRYRRAAARKPARSKPGGGCSSSIPTPANCGRRSMSRSRSRASPRCCAAARRDLSEVTLDMTGIPRFNQRVYAFARTHSARRDPHLWRSRQRARALRARCIRWRRRSRAIPFMIIVPCHRVLESRPLCRQDLAERRRHLQAPAAVDRGRRQPPRARRLFDVLLPGCAAAPAYLNLRHEPQRRFCSAIASRCPTSAAPRGPATSRSRNSIAATRSPMCARAASAATAAASFIELVAGSMLVGHPGDEYICTHDHVCGDECLSFFLAPGTGGSDRRPARTSGRSAPRRRCRN